MKKVSIAIIVISILSLVFTTSIATAQHIYELRKLTDEQWQGMSTEERLESLNTSNNHAPNQPFIGDFGVSNDLYQKWGYDYYDMHDQYENYAFRGFENYADTIDRRNKWYYNQFGDRLTKMRKSATLWRETYNDDGTSDYDNTTRDYLNHTDSVFVDGIWVARESTDDWAVSVVGAEALRVKFTPLTLSLPNTDGLKIDFQSKNYDVSYVSSLLSGERANQFYEFGTTTKNHAVLLLRGGQVRRKFGALTLGATYVNMYSAQTSRSDGNSLQGHVTDYQPSALRYVLRIMDDSPHDGGGPIVSSVMLKINRKLRPDIVPLVMKDDIQKELQTAVYNRNQSNYMEYPHTYEVENDRLDIIERTPKYVDYMYMEDYVRGWNPSNLSANFDTNKAQDYYKVIESGSGPIQVNGTEYVVYVFDVSTVREYIQGVEAEITVANDYRVQTSKIYTDIPLGRQDPEGASYPVYYNATYWDTRAQAEGNVKDGSNVRTISVNFGYEVANIIYGVDAHFNYLGFKIDGEVVVNQHNYMFSDGYVASGVTTIKSDDLTRRTGDRYSISDNAYYIVAQKDWKKFGFVGEYFKMGNFYRPNMKYVDPNIVTGKQNRNRNGTQSRTLIADNDDNDQYPDSMPYKMGMGVRISTFNDPDGVFPGNDLDGDSLPDTDRNFNGIGDYNEPFMMLDSDPDEFVFGDDMNHNSIPDFREDDVKYDTPYDIDRRGHHLYVRYTPQESVDFILGTLQQRGVGLDNRNDDNYVKFRFKYNVASIGRIFTEYRYNRVKDNIQDKYVVVPNRSKKILGTYGQLSRYYNDLYFDETEYRNSSVNKFFVETKMRPLPTVTVENHIKYERNFRLEGTAYDTVYQPEDIINTLAVSNKVVYIKQFGNFSVSPGLKYRFYKKGYRESLNPRIHYLEQIPILFLKYRVSARTNVTLGFQGMKGFETEFKDVIQSQNDYKQKNILLQVENRTDYFGFEVWGGFGFQIEEFKFNEIYREFENYKTTSLFVRMWVGVE